MKGDASSLASAQFVIGTAGHVDHGKSTLVRALTGIDPDRLREEKERGLTIELGFAWLSLPSGREVGVVDVPGHERFIKNMLAGAGGVDLALLVIAADEGPMPQTREHLAILDLLDVPAGIAVITKSDLVEPDYLELVEAEVAETLVGSRLEGAPVVSLSALSGEGLGALLATIDAALDGTPPKRDLGRPRLPIDRAFSIQGFGTVVTGTLLDGALEAGTEVELHPGGRRARIRGLQRHRTSVSRLEPGTRAAVNLSGIRTHDIARGMVLALPGSIAPARVLDVYLQAAATLSHPLAHGAGVTVLCATAETEARLRLLDSAALARGHNAWAQLVLDTPIAAIRGDHCVVRTPNETAAGGRIIAINAKRRRRDHAPTLAVLERLRAGSPEEHLLDLLLSGPVAPAALPALLGEEPAAIEGVVQAALVAGTVVETAAGLASTVWLQAAVGRARAVLEDYLGQNPLRSGVPREHLRGAINLPLSAFDAVVAYGRALDQLEERPGGLVAPAAHSPRPSASQQAECDRFVSALRAGGFSPPTGPLPDPAVLAYLSEQRLVEDTGAGVIFEAGVFAAMVVRLREHLATHPTISLAETRDLFSTSRKYAQAFLEHLDALHLTRRTGDLRTLR